MQRLLLFSLILSLALICDYIDAQKTDLAFTNYTTDDGLPSPEVYYSYQDEQGFMWFCTDNGLSRFDGYEFKNYSHKDGLTDNVVFKVFPGLYYLPPYFWHVLLNQSIEEFNCILFEKTQ